MTPELVALVLETPVDELGRRIRAARVSRGMKQSDLARRAELTGGTYLSRIESGRRRPGPELLERLADALSMPTEHLVLGFKAGDGQRAHYRVKATVVITQVIEAASATDAVTKTQALLGSLDSSLTPTIVSVAAEPVE